MNLKKSCLIFLLFPMFWGCKGKEEETEKYEVRNLDLRVSDDEKAALNFLAVNMNPFVEDAISPNEGDIASQVYFYFSISQKEQSIIIKRENYFDFNRAEGRLEFKELRSVRYCIIPTEFLTPENIVVTQQLEDEISYRWLGYYRYTVKVGTLYNKPVKQLTVWYTTGKGDKPNKIESFVEGTTDGFTLDFKSNSQKAEFFAANFKKLCSIK